ncbi:hypothetical protein PENSPDRAFT_84589 [Peniophora sp. CONT]|nr:hypothetical protein PENSPDRAFT_84589 [Peniophora sp. CONT]
MSFTAFKGKLQPSQTALRSARTALQLALKTLAMACDGLPIPGAQVSINAVLAVLRSFEQATRNDEALGELTKHAEYILSDVIEPTQKALQDADGTMDAELAKMLGKLSGYVDDGNEI